MKTTLTLTAWMLAAFTAAAQSATNDPAAFANNWLGFELFKVVETRTTKGNKFLCPVSADLALAMACNGATGETRAELERLLGVEGQPLEVINARKAGLRTTLARAGGMDFQLSLANSLWARQGFELRESFVQRVISAYEASLSVLDFADPSALATINQWVSGEDHRSGAVPGEHPATRSGQVARGMSSRDRRQISAVARAASVPLARLMGPAWLPWARRSGSRENLSQNLRKVSLAFFLVGVEAEIRPPARPVARSATGSPVRTFRATGNPNH